MAKPRQMVAVVLGVALVTGAAGWTIGSQVTSPADAAAEHRPPPPSLITVPVQHIPLVSTVTAQGTATYTGATPLVLTGVVGGTEGTQLVTKAPAASTVLSAGDELMEVSGRPVFVLPGAVPMYRTLSEGAKGDDVKQLQAALIRLGYALLASGTFDGVTAIAVTHWYEHAGYEPQQSAGQPPQVTVPSGEILFLPKLPVRLDSVTTRAGAQATGQIGTTTDQSLVVQATMPSVDARLVHNGLSTTLTMPDGKSLPANLEAMGAAAAPPAPATTQTDSTGKPSAPTTESDPASTPLRLTAQDPAALAVYAGQAVKVTIQVGKTDGDALVVPVAAVVTGADSKARVQVLRPGGRLEDVPVTLGLTTLGLVAVTSEAGRLSPGDRVVVGGS